MTTGPRLQYAFSRDWFNVPNLKENRMKKLMTAALALAFLSATVAVSFAQEPPKKEDKTKKKGKKKTETPKKEGS
jgi:hypothetical protein